MDCKWIEFSAPGKLMLFGEHAVLHGGLAVVCAVNRRIRVRLQPRNDGVFHLRSQLGEWQGEAKDLHPTGLWRFPLAALAEAGSRIEDGVEIEIKSDFPPDVGLGSSAAVTVALCAALRALTGMPHQSGPLLKMALRVVRAAQGGVGSGADLAAAIYGGVLAYRAAPRAIRQLADSLPLVAAWSGSKTPTPEVIRQVNKRLGRSPALPHFYRAMDAVSAAAAAAILRGDPVAAGRLMPQAQHLLSALGVSSAKLDDLIAKMDALPGIYGAKISGSGMGDCICGIGTISAKDRLPECLDLQVSPSGVCRHD